MASKGKILVQFENVQERYFIDDTKPIKIEYVLNKEYEPSTKDWLGIFPKGWRDLEQQLCADFAVPKSSGSNKCRRSFEFDMRNLYAKMNCFNADYQIVYISRRLQVLGRSSYFRLQKQFGDVHSYGDGLYEGTGMAKIDARAFNSVSPASLAHAIVPLTKTKSCINKIGISVPSWPVSGALPVTGINQGISGTSFPLVRPYRSECLLPMSAQNRNYSAPRCESCLRTNELLEQNQALYKQLKELAESNNKLKNNVVELEKKLEFSLVAQKRLKLLCHHTRQEKRTYEVFVSELLSNLHRNSPVFVSDKGCEMMVQRVNSELENHSVQLTMRHSPQNERYLKAVIGNQELKIQELSAKLAELELHGKKSKIDEKDMEKKRQNSFRKLEEKNKLNVIESVSEVERDTVNSKQDEYKKFPHAIEAVVEIQSSVCEKMQAEIFDVNNNFDNKVEELCKDRENDSKISIEYGEETEKCVNLATSEYLIGESFQRKNVGDQCLDFDLIETDRNQSKSNEITSSHNDSATMFFMNE